MTTRNSKDPAFEPAADLDSPEGEESRRFGLDVVGLDVDVVPGLIIHGLHRQVKSRQRPRQGGELPLLGI
jgi:hypothetical protein